MFTSALVFTLWESGSQLLRPANHCPARSATAQRSFISWPVAKVISERCVGYGEVFGDSSRSSVKGKV
ncbi:Protein of unknown function [Gryllus bimaculatus]|nr:Protein of unknown function [Gryllus bimaculatus]